MNDSIKIEKLNEKFTSYAEKLAIINNDIKYIKDDVKKISNSIDTIYTDINKINNTIDLNLKDQNYMIENNNATTEKIHNLSELIGTLNVDLQNIITSYSTLIEDEKSIKEELEALKKDYNDRTIIQDERMKVELEKKSKREKILWAVTLSAWGTIISAIIGKIFNLF